MLKTGQRVVINYAGELENGYEFVNTWLAHVPVELVIGDGTLLPAFERALVGLARGERCTVTVPAQEAYGEYDPSAVIEVPAANFPHADELPIGSYIGFETDQGAARVKVLGVAGGMVRVDCNHELAGHDLTFEIELVDDGTGDAIDDELEASGCGCDKLRESLVGCSHDHRDDDHDGDHGHHGDHLHH